MEASCINITGITPTLEKAAISFSSPKPSTLQHKIPKISVAAVSGPEYVAKSLLKKSSGEQSNSGLKVDSSMTKKRTLSPEPNTRKRNKSIEDTPSRTRKTGPTFEEPPWE